MSGQSSICKTKVVRPVLNVDPTLPLPVTSLSTLTSHSYQSNEDNMQHNARSFLGQQQLNNFASICGVSSPPINHVRNLLSVQPDCHASLLPYSPLPSSVLFENSNESNVRTVSLVPADTPVSYDMTMSVSTNELRLIVQSCVKKQLF
jgi:hypothetical protein